MPLQLKSAGLRRSALIAADSGRRLRYSLPGVTEEEAQRVLLRVDVVQVAVASMQDIKRMREQCLAADIPALMKRPAGKGGG